MAVGLASVGAFAQGAPVPPGAEAPGYGGDEIETIIVIGDKLRCPDGTKVATINECPGFIQSWLERVYRLPWDPITHVINMASIPNPPTCGATVDASCECGGGKVKAYDDGNDTFHCKTEPPATGCPKWDQTFDFDLNVWACVTRPLDATAQAAVDRVKGCFGLGSTVQEYLGDVLRFEYGSCPGAAIACIPSCTGDGDVVRFDKDNIATRAGRAPDATEWQWFVEALNHELRHVYHNTTYDCGRDPSNPSALRWGPNSNFWAGENVPSSVPRNMVGEEIHTAHKAVEEYHQELGVRSPYDSQYSPSAHKQLKNCQLW